MRESWQGTVVDAGEDAEPVTLPGRPAAVAGADAVRYTTTIEDPRDVTDQVAVLHLNGCYAHATVELSGDVLGATTTPIEHDVYFAPLRIPFRPAPDEQITVTCRAPTDRFGGRFATEAVPAADRVPAVWWQAELEAHPLPFVDDLRVWPAVTDDGAVLHVRTTVVTGGPLDERLTYSLKPAGELQTRGTMERRSVSVDGAGPTTLEHTIDVRDPGLWWPRGDGEQSRYELRATLGESERTVTTGIRTVERDGNDVLVNGEPVVIRGVTLTDGDPADVERAVACNANLVRAHAHALPPSVYEVCDEAGLLVWQDLPLTGPGPFDVERGRRLARAIGEVYGHHPSLAAVAVHDHPTTAFAEGLGDGVLDRLRLRWRAWRTEYDPGPAERVAAAAPEDVITFPVVGDPGVETAARRLFPGWDYARPERTGSLLDRYPAAVVAAFGAGSLGDGDPATAPDFDATKHDRYVADGVDASQTAQARTVKRVAEALRRRDVGAIAATLEDTGGAGMGVYASGGDPKPARDALARAYEPLQAFLVTPDARRSDVVVHNDRPGDVEGALSWQAGDAAGHFEVAVSAGGRWTGGPVSLPAGADRVDLSFEGTDLSVRNTYDRS